MLTTLDKCFIECVRMASKSDWKSLTEAGSPSPTRGSVDVRCVWWGGHTERCFCSFLFSLSHWGASWISSEKTFGGVSLMHRCSGLSSIRGRNRSQPLTIQVLIPIYIACLPLVSFTLLHLLVLITSSGQPLGFPFAAFTNFFCHLSKIGTMLSTTPLVGPPLSLSLFLPFFLFFLGGGVLFPWSLSPERGLPNIFVRVLISHHHLSRTSDTTRWVPWFTPAHTGISQPDPIYIHIWTSTNEIFFVRNVSKLFPF